TDLIVGGHAGADRSRSAGILVPGFTLGAGRAQIHPGAILGIQHAHEALAAVHLLQHEAAIVRADAAAEPAVIDHIGSHAPQLELAAAPGADQRALGDGAAFRLHHGA